jgi:hypothetical protein
MYVLILHAGILLTLFVIPTSWLSNYFFFLMSLLLITEICQYHVYLMIIRPVIDRTYTQYNFARTMILTLISYQGLISLFALLLLSKFSQQLSVPAGEFNAVTAWSLSAGILTGTGFSGIAPKPGSLAAVVGGIESIVGILFLTTILGLALTRSSAKALDVSVWRGPQLVDPGKIRVALVKAGKAMAIDQLQQALQTDLWVTGGWLRTYALGGDEYDGDLDLLVNGLSHDELAQRLTDKGIRYSRGRLGGFKFSPAPGIKIDCFSTRTFGPAISVQESFTYFNATVNAAAFKFSSPELFFTHPLFEHNATKRLLRILPDGLLQQPLQDRGRSLLATLLLLTRESLALVPDESTRDLVRTVAKQEQFSHGCLLICKMLDQANRQHEAEVLRGWLY